VQRLGLLVVALAIALGAAGCGIKAEPTGDLAAFPSRAVDGAGREVGLAAPPERIVVADEGAANVLREIGVPAELVEVDLAESPQDVADPAADLVVLPLGADAAGVPADVPVFAYGAADVRDAPSAIAQLGLAVGRGAEGAAIAARVARGLDGLADRVAREGEVRTLIADGAFEGYGPETPIGRTVAAAGGGNVLTASELLELDAVGDLDVQAWVALEPGGTPWNRLAGIPQLRTVPAVRDGRVIPVPVAGYPIDGGLPGRLESLADDLRAPAVERG
jgi:ABC-type Fe3+-hydroxamate transport system substrate-binding protein